VNILILAKPEKAAMTPLTESAEQVGCSRKMAIVFFI
jgi:hypothetical protein